MIDAKGSNLKTRKFTLKRGLCIAGVYHKDLEIREEVISDCLGMAEEIVSTYGVEALSEKDINSTLIKDLLQTKRRITKVGTLSKEEVEGLTIKDYAEKLNSTDFAICSKAKGFLDAEMYAVMEITDEDKDEIKKNLEK